MEGKIMNIRTIVNHIINSFIHYGDLYSAPSRLLLRSAPDPCTAKKKSFETRVECVLIYLSTHPFIHSPTYSFTTQYTPSPLNHSPTHPLILSVSNSRRK